VEVHQRELRARLKKEGKKHEHAFFDVRFPASVMPPTAKLYSTLTLTRLCVQAYVCHLHISAFLFFIFPPLFVQSIKDDHWVPKEEAVAQYILSELSVH